jgi:hypothetical protein
MAETTYTAEQIATAARELLEAAGSEQPEKVWPPEGTLVEDHAYTLTEALGHMEDEVRLLRERGFTDEHIADLLSGFDIEVTAHEIAHRYPERL